MQTRQIEHLMRRGRATVSGPGVRCSRVVRAQPGRYHGVLPAADGEAQGRPTGFSVSRMTTIHASAPLGLLQRTAKGDAASVRECIDRYGGLVWSIARKLTFTEAEAQDAVQEIFVELWRCADRYDPTIASETAFVATIARRRLIDRRRRAARDPVRESLDQQADAPAVGTTDRAELSDEARQAVSALDQLSPEQQNVLRLSIYQGLSHERISRAIGLPLGTVKTHARRGLLKLRALLEATGPAGRAARGAEGNA